MGNQEAKQASVRAATGTSLDYNSDWSALFDQSGIGPFGWNGRLLSWINLNLGTAYADINAAMAAFAIANGAPDWNSLGSFSVIPLGAIVVSGSAFGLLPTGNDTTGSGTAAAPYATLTKALSVAPEGAQIILNGSPSSPTIYAAPTFFSITKGVRIDALYPYGATLQGTGAQTRVLNLAPTSGQTITLGKVTIDATNTIGSCVLISDQATTFTVNANGTKFVNWTTQCFAATASATATKVNATLNGCSFAGDNTRSAVYFKALSAGSVSLSACDINITNQNTSGHGAVIVWANATGCSCSVTSSAINIGVNGTVSTSTVYGAQIFNIPNAQVTSNLFTGSGVASTKPMELIQVCANSAAPLDSSGAYVARNAIAHNANGGMCIEIGEDNQDSGSRGFVNGAVVEFNSITCNALSAAGVTHGLFNSEGANSIVRYNIVRNAGISLADKEGSGARFYGNISIDASNSHIRLKGSVNAKYTHNTIIERSTATTWPILISNNATNGHVGSGSVVTGNICYVQVASGRYASVSSAEGVALSANDYFATVSLVTNPWQIDATGYGNLTAWRAAGEATAISADPQFINAANDNYDIGHGATALDIVPADAGIQLDYLSRPFASPATAGAYQRQ